MVKKAAASPTDAPVAAEKKSAVRASVANAVNPAESPTPSLSPAQKALRKLGLLEDLDFALHLPMRYEDETRITAITAAALGQETQIAVTVTAQQVLLRGRKQLVLQVSDETGSCQLRFFNFYASQVQQWAVGARLRVRGVLQGGGFDRYMLHPVCKPLQDASQLPTTLTPVYPSSAQLPQAYLRKAVANCLARADRRGQLTESIAPFALLRAPREIWLLTDALQFLHHPRGVEDLPQLEDKSHPAWQRLVAEELLAQQLAQYQARLARQSQQAQPLIAERSPSVLQTLMAQLPFALTGAQTRVCVEIAADLRRAQPMHRLLQGDVGSGKTMVAAIAAMQAIDAGAQCALLAPTEILAMQHFHKLLALLQPILEQAQLAVIVLRGGQKKAERRAALESIAQGRAALIIGTHALLEDSVRFAHLGLVIIDEQHRFGVAQRLSLREKNGAGLHEPHTLMMSATPIPRTLAMSYYADLDVSTIDELPPGRQPIVTKVFALNRYEEILERVAQRMQSGGQVYWVCPLIEESETLDLGDATARYQALCQALPTVRIALLHARLTQEEKSTIMQQFADGKIALLVATTVIEVGVDVPNAATMVIEHAERFGLSQLHQLRGRVGRGCAASICILLYASGRLSETARLRLKAMAQSQDGFWIAQQDLRIRGPGEFMGARQSGAALLRFADLERDADWLAWASDCAPLFWQKDAEGARRHVHKCLGGKLDYFKA